MAYYNAAAITTMKSFIVNASGYKQMIITSLAKQQHPVDHEPDGVHLLLVLLLLAECYKTFLSVSYKFLL